MKEIFRNISSIFLALMVLLSTVSWTVDKHLCMGRVMDVSFFAHADDCGMEEAMAAMGTEVGENHCCDDESFTLKGQDDLKLSWYDLELEHQAFLVAFTQSYFDLFVPVEELPVPHEKYPPPILVRDVQVLDQVFLI
ncbi:HYC_CC_PP family protein [Flagellimonas pacifica]|uniref:Secreted protein n=1 Tax=Flagellimonas pacifica TaxID=1247520 RepID=A0A285MBC0_9FLAO|nr:hypothetical protein [Allomuricauda parva]SNY94474.1 hypothetical protein SAMN06265377_0133 [Allomuricauda parva]